MGKPKRWLASWKRVKNSHEISILREKIGLRMHLLEVRMQCRVPRHGGQAKELAGGTQPRSSLVSLLVLWSAAWTTSYCKGIKTVRDTIKWAVTRRLPRGASNALTRAVISQPEDEPFFAADKGRVAAAKRYAIASRWCTTAEASHSIKTMSMLNKMM